MSWEQRLSDAIQKNAMTDVVVLFKSLCTDHASTPNQAVKAKAMQIIRKIYKDNDAQLYDVAMKLANMSDETCEEIGLILLAEKYHMNPAQVTENLYKLSDSPNWEVREWAASACSIVLSHHFDDFKNVLMNWTRDDSPNVRRCVAVAVKYVSKEKKDSYFTGLVELIHPLLSDDDPYVKKNLGAFAIGDGLLKYYPNEMIGKIHEWIRIDNEQVRSNIAMIFTSSVAAKNFESLKDIFLILQQDKRGLVQKAVKQAEKNLAKRLT